MEKAAAREARAARVQKEQGALDQTGIPSVSLGEHRAIVDCIAAGQAAAAGRLLREHVVASRDRMHRKTGHPLPAARPRRARKSA